MNIYESQYSFSGIVIHSLQMQWFWLCRFSCDERGHHCPFVFLGVWNSYSTLQYLLLKFIEKLYLDWPRPFINYSALSLKRS